MFQMSSTVQQGAVDELETVKGSSWADDIHWWDAEADEHTYADLNPPEKHTA